jgi:hypothetical protein
VAPRKVGRTESAAKDIVRIVIFAASSITDRDIDDFVACGAKPVSLDDLTGLIEKYRNV